VETSCSFKRSLVTIVLGALALAFAPVACGSDGGAGGPKPGIGGSGAKDGGTGGAGTGGSGAYGSGMCLLNNCNSDAECEGCTFGRNTCKLDENRCIACDPVAGTGCKPGEKCTAFGTCAPLDLECKTDGAGNPTVSCGADADCLACDPMHQKCDTATGKCQACTPDDTQHCLGSDTCKAGKCEQKCPANCAQDSDCSSCDTGGKQAFACQNHVCSECSDTMGCLPGLECQKGACVKPCGKAGSPIEGGGECQTTAECYGCGNSEATESWQCKFPINGGNHGSCMPPAEGCTDLSKSGAVLPPPFDQVTNLCSNDGNCANVSIDLNVGKLIRDLVGKSEIDLGLKKVQIKDAILKYDMSKCASIQIKENLSCGVCVPCKTDLDCKPIALDPLVSELFKGDPLAQLGAAFLMDWLFGKGEQHELHMQCLPVAQGYGVCSPCSNPTKACGTGSSGQTGSGKCDHNVCEAGTPLDPTCGLCAAAVCLKDFYCCTVGWDEMCMQHVNDVCAVGCDGTTTCTHNPCELGGSMHKACSPCTEKVCQIDPYCCNLENGGWDQVCVDIAKSQASCTPECSGQSSCLHSECEIGSKLESGCSACATEVCTKDPFCCDKEWDKFCVSWAKQSSVQAICNCPQ
jgi:hypothetical protein